MHWTWAAPPIRFLRVALLSIGNGLGRAFRYLVTLRGLVELSILLCLLWFLRHDAIACFLLLKFRGEEYVDASVLRGVPEGAVRLLAKWNHYDGYLRLAAIDVTKDQILLMTFAQASESCRTIEEGLIFQQFAALRLCELGFKEGLEAIGTTGSSGVHPMTIPGRGALRSQQFLDPALQALLLDSLQKVQRSPLLAGETLDLDRHKPVYSPAEKLAFRLAWFHWWRNHGERIRWDSTRKLFALNEH